jgi:hypothetical protein
MSATTNSEDRRLAPTVLGGQLETLVSTVSETNDSGLPNEITTSCVEEFLRGYSEGAALAAATVKVLAPCTVACDIPDHEFTGIMSAPDDLDREHRLIVGAVGDLQVIISVFEYVYDGAPAVCELPRIAVYQHGAVWDEVADIEPKDAAELGALLVRAAELASAVSR